MRKFAILMSGVFALAMLPSAANAAICIGNCGSSGPDGVVTVAPTGDGTYDWVSTSGGQTGAGQIEGFSEDATNGSELISDPFFAASGQEVTFWFNYVTSDGSGFADYAFAQLVNTSSGNTSNLFTARTKPTGVIVPGQDLPGLEASLSPANVFINPGAPVWSPLGGSSGSCFDVGCGHTGWVQSVFQVVDPGTYELRFGVTNWSDTAFDSGLAFSGLVLDGSTIGDGSSASQPLLPGEIGANGAFLFEFVATPNEMVFVDPEVAVGYDYEVLSGPNILTALFPELGDSDGYDIFLLSDLDNPIVTGWLAGAILDFADYGFADGVSGFALRDIETDLMLDPTNTTAFVTGLTFNIAGGSTTINLSQTPVTVVTDAVIPEPATWAMMIGGFALTGVALRRRRRMAALAA